MKSLLYLRRYLRHYWRSIALGAASILIANWFGLLIPRYVGKGVDYIKSASPTMRGLGIFAIIIIGLELVQATFTFLMRFFMYGAARNIEFDFRNDLFTKFQSLHSGYYDTQKVGDLMARSTNDVEAIRMLLGPGILFLVNTLFIFPLAFYQMLSINPPLTFYSIIPLIIMPFYVNAMGNRIHKRFRSVQDQFSVITAMVQENLAGIRVIKAFVREKAQGRQFKKLNTEFIRRNLSLARIRAGFFPGMRLLGGVGIMILLWMGGRRVIQGKVSLGDLTALIMIHMRLFWPMIAFGWIISLHQRGAASLSRILEIVNVAPDIADTKETDHSLKTLEGDIRFNGLCFQYPEEEASVLNDIDLHIPRGSTLGVVGPIGSGKTTLIRLLVRLYNPPQGAVFIDNRDVRAIPIKLLRRHIGYVFQVPFLFSVTIHNNITFGVGDVPREQVEEIAKKVQLHEEIMSLASGYETMLGERGINLSGGQKQRLALARALIKDPDILILDDTLSAVDTETEARILSMLKKEMKKRTAIVISHRISSVISADEIIFLEKGRIAEQGTHDQLIARGGHYAAIYEKQRLEQEIEKEE